MLCREALGDGLSDVLIAWRFEEIRPADCVSQDHLQAYEMKARHALDELKRQAAKRQSDLDLCGLRTHLH